MLAVESLATPPRVAVVRAVNMCKKLSQSFQVQAMPLGWGLVARAAPETAVQAGTPPLRQPPLLQKVALAALVPPQTTREGQEV